MTKALMSELMKASGNEYISKLTESVFLNEREMISTDVYGLNVCLSGEIDGGFGPGLTVIAGKSRNFKSLFAIAMVGAFLKKHEEGVCVFFDSEFGSPMEYFAPLGEDVMDRIIHAPITTMEELKIQSVKILEKIDRGTPVIFLLDSYGNLGSEKEIDDAIKGDIKAEVGTRAKIGKSIFRLLTSKLVLRGIPMIAINHTYDTLEMFSKQVMTGGTGILFAADNVIFVGKQQEKEGAELIGNNFVLNIEKSRFAREKMKYFVKVTFEEGIDKYSGIFDLGVASGLIGNPTKGYYQYPNEEDGKKVRRKELEIPEVMQEIVDKPEFKAFVASKYKLVYENVEEET